MQEFPTEKEQFYRLRDDRTNRYIVSRDYQNVACVVTIEPELMGEYAGQVCLLTTCNLLSRWCRRVCIVLSANPSLHTSISKQKINIREALLEQMSDADPFGEFVVDHESPKTDRDAIQIHIGDSFEQICSRYVITSAAGWYASVSTNRPMLLGISPDENGIGAMAAACLGVAQVFKFAIDYPQDLFIRDGIFDLFHQERIEGQNAVVELPYPQDLDVGRMLMVGAGSIGSASAFAFKLLGVSADLMIVDHDLVKIENFNRSPVFGKSSYGTSKASAVARFLEDSSVNATFCAGDWNQFLKREGDLKNKFDIWLPLANEMNVRWSMQNNVPPLMIHASTTQNWGVNFGRHIPGSWDCLADRFQEAANESELSCSTTAIQIGEVEVDAALPFLSFLGGLFVAADLIKLKLDDYPQTPGFLLADLGGPFDEILLVNKAPRPNCICSATTKLSRKFNGETRYFSLRA